MSSSIYNKSTVTKDIKFINSHIGGNNDGSKETFEEQVKLNDEIDNSDTTFKNKSKNKNDGFNSYPTIINNRNNITNQLVIPEEYDSFVEYLEKKNLNNINSRVITNFNYINIDSSQNVNNISNNYINLEYNPLIIKDNSNILEIKVGKQNIDKFSLGCKITLQGLIPTSKNLSNVSFIFTNGSNMVIVNIDYDFTKISKFYDILIKFSDIKNNGLDYFENIPLNALNQIQNMYLINNNTQIAFNLPIFFYSNNLTTLMSSCKINIYNIANVPVSNINASDPYSRLNLISYHTVYIISDDTLFIQLPIKVNLKYNKLEFGGNNIQIGLLDNLVNSSDYVFICNFNYRYNNIASIKMISSELSIPNINADNLFINYSNNKFYWSNLIDYNQVYSITIPNGLYNYDTLKEKMTQLLNTTKRINSNTNLYPYNIFSLKFESRINLFSFSSYNKYILPKCFKNFTNIGNNTYKITISQVNHLLTVLDEIEISGSIDYYVISQLYINKTHIVSNVISKDLYEITITNINEIPDVGDTNGGYSINIITKNSFSLLFNYDNTVGEILKFRDVGLSSSITPFSNKITDYVITNKQYYLFNNISNNKDDGDSINNPNFSYLLLLCEELNHCQNPFNVNYFYKFLFNNTNTTNVGVLYNTYVESPLFLNPPISYLDSLKLTFVNPEGEKINYKTFKYSFTLEIVTITNETENTNININIAKL